MDQSTDQSTLNDVHSALNETTVSVVVRPSDLAELSKCIQLAKHRGLPISVAGGRHAMGGQQFATNSVHIDTTALTKVLSQDNAKGLIEVEAGIMWPALIQITGLMQHPDGGHWAIAQKQTGVDHVCLGGSISAAAHGRGLAMQPISADVESLTLVDADGVLQTCSRENNSQLFSLVIGGYGLFGLIYSVKLRLTKRLKLIRIVDVVELDDASNAISRRLNDGYLYGDFQYSIDPADHRFMQKGVFACYRPAPENSPEPNAVSDLPPQAWLKLLALAHTDKANAFKTYAAHYLQTDGNVYWSDTMQLSTYIPSYTEYLSQCDLAQAGKESLVIGEHYVPPDQVQPFMQQARAIFRDTKVEVIYGTIRLIQTDDTTFLAWAKKPYVCIIFNLRTEHSSQGLARTRNAFLRLTDASIELGGSFYLTYHRYAIGDQITKAYPRAKQFFQLKKQYDPQELFQSDWYRHYREYFNHA